MEINRSHINPPEFVSDKERRGAERKCEERKEGGRTGSIAEQIGGVKSLIGDKVARCDKAYEVKPI